MHFISLFILSPLFYFWNDKIRTRSCSADLNYFTFLSKRQIRRQLAKPLHRIFSASPHSHDGATHGVTHGHRKYHHQLHVIRRLTTLPTLFYGVNNIAPAHLPLLLSRPLIPAYSPFGSSHTERIWCLIHLLKVLCRPEETPLLEGAPSDLQICLLLLLSNFRRSSEMIVLQKNLKHQCLLDVLFHFRINDCNLFTLIIDYGRFFL